MEEASAAQQQTLSELRAAHELVMQPHRRSADAMKTARKVCHQLHGRLAAFCSRWVPSGAEAEKVAILDQLKEVELVLEGLQGSSSAPAS
jgi:hypothetical protein